MWIIHVDRRHSALFMSSTCFLRHYTWKPFTVKLGLKLTLFTWLITTNRLKLACSTNHFHHRLYPTRWTISRTIRLFFLFVFTSSFFVLVFIIGLFILLWSVRLSWLLTVVKRTLNRCILSRIMIQWPGLWYYCLWSHDLSTLLFADNIGRQMKLNSRKEKHNKIK